MDHLDIIQGADGGWIKYILKRTSKANWFHSIHWQNFHNPCASCQLVTPVISAQMEAIWLNFLETLLLADELKEMLPD